MIGMRRIINKEVLRAQRGKPCVICAAPGVGHHVKSKGSGGDDKESNLMPLCLDHHNLGGDSVHRIGLKEFAQRFKKVENWLIDNNWEKCEISGKWFNSGV